MTLLNENLSTLPLCYKSTYWVQVRMAKVNNLTTRGQNNDTDTMPPGIQLRILMILGLSLVIRLT